MRKYSNAAKRVAQNELQAKDGVAGKAKDDAAGKTKNGAAGKTNLLNFEDFSDSMLNQNNGKDGDGETFELSDFNVSTILYFLLFLWD